MGEKLMATTVTRISVQDLCEQEGLASSTVTQIVQYEIAEPVAGTSVRDWVFDTTGSHWIKKPLRLQRDLELEWLAVALLVDLLRERESLMRENRQLRRRLGRLEG